MNGPITSGNRPSANARKPSISAGAVVAATDEYVVVLARDTVKENYTPAHGDYPDSYAQGHHCSLHTLMKDGRYHHTRWFETLPGRPKNLGRGFYITPYQQAAIALLHSHGLRVMGTEN